MRRKPLAFGLEPGKEPPGKKRKVRPTQHYGKQDNGVPLDITANTRLQVNLTLKVTVKLYH